MAARPTPTDGVARSRRYAAHVRIVIALVGGALLAADPTVHDNAVAAAIGLAVIGVTGVVESLVKHEGWLKLEEALSCVAAVFIVGVSGGQVTAITLLWLVAAAVGVLARGGRVGSTGRVLVVGALLSPLVVHGSMSAENVGLAVGAIALLLASGRISRETGELLRQARHDADHDALTGLLAREAFRRQVDVMATRATTEEPANLIMLDLDDFGAVNKRHGHSAGDALLADVAAAMQAELRLGDVLGRVGGDEFAVFAFGSDPEPLVARLLEATATAAGGGAVGASAVGASAGASRCPADGDDAEALLAAADVALRAGKRQGRGGFSVYRGAPLGTSSSLGARAALERLASGDGVEMAVQPIVDVRTGRPHAYEALARFAGRGGEGPLHWFTLADELGMRAELELACLDAALRLLPGLPDGARLSVNLSAPMLVDARVGDRLRAEADISRLIVEVTEETLVRHEAGVEEIVGRLAKRGTLVAVDDIGAGYSGLGQLATLRPSYLKLDRALVRGIDGDSARASLLRFLVDYSSSTGGMLVAEGVETEAELAEVLLAGAPLVQGYLLARPGPPWPVVDARALPRKGVQVGAE
jgi:diguanylate cyclase (GGDEF)-like protein